MGEMAALFSDEVFNIGSDETSAKGRCGVNTSFAIERRLLQAIQHDFKKVPEGWEVSEQLRQPAGISLSFVRLTALKRLVARTPAPGGAVRCGCSHAGDHRRRVVPAHARRDHRDRAARGGIARLLLHGGGAWRGGRLARAVARHRFRRPRSSQAHAAWRRDEPMD
eukprot:SAG25_NODE_113_length_14872_cov_23.149527_20_plen_166_part_00